MHVICQVSTRIGPGQLPKLDEIVVGFGRIGVMDHAHAHMHEEDDGNDHQEGEGDLLRNQAEQSTTDFNKIYER